MWFETELSSIEFDRGFRKPRKFYEDLENVSAHARNRAVTVRERFGNVGMGLRRGRSKGRFLTGAVLTLYRMQIENDGLRAILATDANHSLRARSFRAVVLVGAFDSLSSMWSSY